MTPRPFVRTLQLELPYARGLDVLALQRRLSETGAPVGTPDGIFGAQTDKAIRVWESANGLPQDGKCDESNWRRLFPQTDAVSAKTIDRATGVLTQDHGRFAGSCQWRLAADGLHINGAPAKGSGGPPTTIEKIWREFGDSIARWSSRFGVPAELIVATIATESSGDPAAIRFEPNYKSDLETPNQVSPGLMQTLISTARSALGDNAIDRGWLLQADNSIKAGTAYILKQSQNTGFDPPVVACCYNAGSVVENDSAQNRWRMRQFPIGTSAHCDRFVEWFNDCVTVFAGLPSPPSVSFSARLKQAPTLQ